MSICLPVPCFGVVQRWLTLELQHRYHTIRARYGPEGVIMSGSSPLDMSWPISLCEMAGDFLQEAAEDQDILRHTAHPTGAWDWEPPAAAFPEGAEELDLLADVAALEGHCLSGAATMAQAAMMWRAGSFI